jgi:polar amino acid transport system substrate-binding protein
MSKSRVYLFITAIAVLAAVVLTAGCGDGGDEGTTGEAAATLTVGSDIPYAPFEYGRAPDYQGIDIDLVREIGKRIGRNVEFVDTSFDTIIRDLAAGKFDMVASSTTITPERKKEVDFSDPYFLADQSLMIKKGSDIKSVDDVAGKTVGAQKGTTGADFAKDKTKAKSVRTYAEIDDAFNALGNGQVDAVINDCPISKYAERAKPDLSVIQLLPTNENYGFAFKKGSTDLISEVNQALKEIVDDGTYQKIFTKYLSTDPCKSIASG